MSHPSFRVPDDSSATIWRYMDFAKFVAMLDAGALYFSRVDLLGDAFEGAIPQGNEQYWREVRERFPDREPLIQENQRTTERLIRFSRAHTFVNCWHVSMHESAAMWAQYAQAGASIAIQSCASLLQGALPSGVHVGLVRYIDYDTMSIAPTNVLDYCLHKRQMFEHEKELRALVWALECDSGSQQQLWCHGGGQTGISVEVNLKTLIEAVYVAPSSESWFGNLVEHVIRKYDLCAEVHRSRLGDLPAK